MAIAQGFRYAVAMLHLGVCYYPEHWPRARWRQDATLMREAGFNTVRLAEFAWGLLEPEPGTFTFEWLDTAIETLAAADLQVVLGTPSAAPPAWLTAAHPDVLPVGADGQLRMPGSRRHYCVTCELYQEHVDRVVIAMAERYGAHPAVIGWQIDNELGCHDTTRCYCLRCQNAFQDWLAHRYASVEALNTAWGTAFWSQRYGRWEEVLVPQGMVYDANPGHWLDWCRFSSESNVKFLQRQVDLLRRLAPAHWLTHNFMGGFDDLDYTALAAPLDIVGWDNYAPTGSTPASVAFGHDRMRGHKRRSFWVLEQQCGQINWSLYNPTLRPGEARLRTFQAVARGADGVLYFRWRSGPIGAEQLHSGVLPHDGIPGRTYRELTATAAELALLPEMGVEPAPIALWWSEANRWALKQQPHHQTLREVGPDAYDQPFYEVLHGWNQPVDVLAPSQDLTGVRVLVAGTQYLADEAMALRLIDFVRLGGHLVLSVRSGFKDLHNRVSPQGPLGPLRQLLGTRVLEFDSPPPEVVNGVRFADGATVPVSSWMEVLAPSEDVEVVARYTDDYYAGEPAIVARTVGLGKVWYLGALGEGTELAQEVLGRVLSEAGIPVGERADGVEVVSRPSEAGRVWFYMNHRAEPRQVVVEVEGEDLLNGGAAPKSLTLPAYGVAVIREPHPESADSPSI